MTKLLERAFAEASRLSPEDQDALGDWLLKELESEDRWKRLFSETQDTLSSLAAEALDEHHAGRTQPLDPERL